MRALHVNPQSSGFRVQGKRLVFVTNASNRSAAQLQAKLNRLGFEAHDQAPPPSPFQHY